MDKKQVYIIATVVGSFLGGLIPLLWGAGMFSFSSIIFNAIGAIAGLYIAFKMSNY